MFPFYYIKCSIAGRRIEDCMTDFLTNTFSGMKGKARAKSITVSAITTTVLLASEESLNNECA